MTAVLHSTPSGAKIASPPSASPPSASFTQTTDHDLSRSRRAAELAQWTSSLLRFGSSSSCSPAGSTASSKSSSSTWRRRTRFC